MDDDLGGHQKDGIFVHSIRDSNGKDRYSLKLRALELISYVDYVLDTNTFTMYLWMKEFYTHAQKMILQYRIELM